MGFTTPRTNINKSGSVINQEIRRFNDTFDEEFDNVNAAIAENIAGNMKDLEAAKVKREIGDDLWYQTVDEFTPPGGVTEEMQRMLDDMHDQYYSILDCDTPECRRQKENFLKAPQIIAQTTGAHGELNKQRSDALSIKTGQPGSLNPGMMDSDLNSTLKYGANPKNKLTFDPNTGRFTTEIMDEEGKAVNGKNGKPLVVDYGKFTKDAVEGRNVVATFPDPKGVRKELQEGALKEMDYNGLVSKLEENSFGKSTASLDYGVANQTAKDYINGMKIESTLGNLDLMRNSYPQIVQGLFDQAAADDPTAIQALDNLGLLGDDGYQPSDLDALGDFVTNQAKIGTYTGSDAQKEAARAFYHYLDPEDALLKAGGRTGDDGRVVKSKTEGLTTAESQKNRALNQKDRALDQAEDKITNETERIRLAKVAQEISEKKGKDATPGQKIDYIKWYKNEVAEGNEVSENEKKIFDRYEKELAQSEAETPAPEGGSEKPAPESDPEATDFGTLTGINVENATQKINAVAKEKGLKPGQTFNVTIEGKQRTMVYNGDGKKPTPYKGKPKGSEASIGQNDNKPETSTETNTEAPAKEDSDVPPGGFKTPMNSMQRTYNNAARIKPGEEGYDDYERDENGIIKKDKNGAPFLKNPTPVSNPKEETIPSPQQNTEKPVVEEVEEVVEEKPAKSNVKYGASNFNTAPTETQAADLKKAARLPKTEKGFIEANQLFEKTAGRTDDGVLKATPQSKADLNRYFYTADKIPPTKNSKGEEVPTLYSDGKQKYGTKKLFPNGKPNTAAYDIVAMVNMNSSFNPKVIAAIASGKIPASERGDYLFNRKGKNIDDIKIDINTVDPQKLLIEMTDQYKNTFAKGEDSKTMKANKQFPEQYASYIERVKFIADRYGLELPNGYDKFGTFR